MNPTTQPVPPSLNRSMRVRVVEELFITVDPDAPGAAWSARLQRDGTLSVVGLLAVNDDGDGNQPLSLVSLLDRSPLLPLLEKPRLIGVCEGAGMVFEEAQNPDGIPRRWIVFPMEAPGLVVA